MKRLLLCSVLLSSAIGIAAPAVVEKTADEMVKTGATVTANVDDEIGVYVIGIGREVIVVDTPEKVNELRVIARTSATQEIASFIGTTIQNVQRHELSENKTGVEEYFSSVTESEVKELLKGVQDLRSGRNDKGEMEVIVFIMSKGPQLQLEENLSEDGSGVVRAVGIDVQRDQAEKKALISAVEQVVGALTVCKRTVDEENDLKERMGATAYGLVDAYRIVGDVVVQDGYKVSVIARVSKRKVYESYKAFFKALHDPIFYVESTDATLKDEFMQFFINKGVSISTNKDKAHYIINLTGTYSAAMNPLTKNADGTQLALALSIVSKEDERILMHIKNTPKKATKYGAMLTEDQRKNFVAKRAFREVHEKLEEEFHNFVLRLLDEAE